MKLSGLAVGANHGTEIIGIGPVGKETRILMMNTLSQMT